jgi:ABC-type dipeptide/oligopeptide/nickel transport system permease component
MLLMLFVGLRWGLLPIFGADSWKHLIMPAITLSLRYTGVLTRLSRSAVVEVLQEDYIRTARAKGLSERVVIYKHALRNAALPIVTVAGLELAGLLNGSVITETVFAYPGVGWLAVQAIRQHDFPIVRVFVMVVAVFFITANLIVDITYAFLDPRVVYN